MGRGRAKAKQTKVARQLKYHTPSTDLDQLQRELTGGGGKSAATSVEPPQSFEEEYGDTYADPYRDDED
jgi:hypothetical protein